MSGPKHEISINQLADLPNKVFKVEVKDNSSKTTHIVTVDEVYAHHLIEKKDVTPENLLDQSFRFLLEREPKESILAEFDLSVIEQYFSDYRSVIRQRLS